MGTRNCWFNTGAYAAPAGGAFGNVSRNSIYGPSNFRFDLSVSRKFNLGESRSMQFRFESFNILNHPNLGNPVLGMNSSNFGRIQTQSGDSRTLQAALKFAF